MRISKQKISPLSILALRAIVMKFILEKIDIAKNGEARHLVFIAQIGALLVSDGPQGLV